MNEEANVDDVMADCVGGKKRLEDSRGLNKLDFVSLGVRSGEPSAAISSRFHLPRHFPGFRAEIAAHGFRVVRVPGGVVEPIDARALRQRKHLNELRVADGVTNAFR